MINKLAAIISFCLLIITLWNGNHDLMWNQLALLMWIGMCDKAERKLAKYE